MYNFMEYEMSKEKLRVKKLHLFENEYRSKGYKLIAGVDEVGRGPLAGPVVAAACVLPENFFIEGINDSKKVTEENRLRIFNELTNHPDVYYSISVVDAIVIDQINIHQASLLAMKKAFQGLNITPDFLLFDGRQHPMTAIPCTAIIGGDSKSISIAAASIIAKCTRDKIMDEFHEQYPEYGFLSHKGYATEKHRKALMNHGPCAIHRRSFEPVKVLFT